MCARDLAELEQLLGAQPAHLLGGVAEPRLEEHGKHEREHLGRGRLAHVRPVAQAEAGGAEGAPRRRRRVAHRLLDVVHRAHQPHVQIDKLRPNLDERTARQQLRQREAAALSRAPEPVDQPVAHVLQHRAEVLVQHLLGVRHERGPQLAHRDAHLWVWVERVAVERRHELGQVLLEVVLRLLGQGEGDALARVPDGAGGRALHQLVDELGLPRARGDLGELLVRRHVAATRSGVGGAGRLQPAHELLQDCRFGRFVTRVEEGGQALCGELLRQLLRVGKQPNEHALHVHGCVAQLGRALRFSQDGEQPRRRRLPHEGRPVDCVLQEHAV
mmetsp:Transcript_5503/g.11980  ORF Transcript_5503/g.11980 Transcript_5503/m.11980 type:complete len:330 (-) Transcript_5503:2132-3121(-)|eukprot:3886287-Pleurochrysis_carterae.AAC.9